MHCFKYNDVAVSLNASTAEGALMTPIDFTLSNARRFYSSMENPFAVKGSMQIMSVNNEISCYKEGISHVIKYFR